MYETTQGGASLGREIWTGTLMRWTSSSFSLRGPYADITKKHRLQIELSVHIIVFCEEVYIQQVAFPNVHYVCYTVWIMQGLFPQDQCCGYPSLCSNHTLTSDFCVPLQLAYPKSRISLAAQVCNII